MLCECDGHAACVESCQIHARSMHTAGMKILRKPAQNAPKSHVISQNEHVIWRHGIVCYGMVWNDVVESRPSCPAHLAQYKVHYFKIDTQYASQNVPSRLTQVQTHCGISGE